MSGMMILASSNILYIIGGTAVVVALAFLGLFIAARMKGKLVLALNKGGYAPGEIINGDLQLITKRAIEGNRLFVALVGYEEVRRRVTDSDGKDEIKTERHEVYRDELDLIGAGHMPAGTEKSLPFQLGTPNLRAGEANPGGLIGAAAGALGSMMGTGRKMIWEVQARYDVKGVDLKTKKRITVSGG